MFHNSKSVINSLSSKNYSPIGDIHVSDIMTTKKVGNSFITSSEAGLLVISDTRYTYVVCQTRDLPTILTAKVDINGHKSERLCYLADTTDCPLPTVFRVEMESIIKATSYGSYILTDATKVTVQGPDGAITNTVLPALNEMISRQRIRPVPASDGVPSYNQKYTQFTTLVDNCSSFGGLPSTTIKDRSGERVNLSDVHFMTFGRGKPFIDARDIISAAAPLLVVHRLSCSMPLVNSLCSMNDDERIYLACASHNCRSCAVAECLQVATRDYFAVSRTGPIRTAIRNQFLYDYRQQWLARYHHTMDNWPCVCTDVPTEPTIYSEDADEVTDDDLPPLIPLSDNEGRSEMQSPIPARHYPSFDEVERLRIRAPKRQRFNPEDSDYDEEA